MSWSKEQVCGLIEQYKKYPCLYAVKSPQYKNKHARLTALEAIVKEVNDIRPGLTINEVKAKYQGLRANFLNEHGKYKKFLQSGTGEDNVYRPTIWYYDAMFFLLDHCESRQSVDSINNQEIHTNTTNFEDSVTINEDILQYVDNVEIVHIDDVNTVHSTDSEDIREFLTENSYNDGISRVPKVQTQNRTSTPTNIKKRKRTDEGEKALLAASDAIKTMSAVIKEKKSAEKHHYDTFGDYVVSKMKQMNPEIANEIEEQICLLLFKGIQKSKNNSN